MKLSFEKKKKKHKIDYFTRRGRYRLVDRQMLCYETLQLKHLKRIQGIDKFVGFSLTLYKNRFIIGLDFKDVLLWLERLLVRSVCFFLFVMIIMAITYISVKQVQPIKLYVIH